MSEENETTLDDMLIEKEMGGAEQKVFLHFGMLNCKMLSLQRKLLVLSVPIIGLRNI